VNLRCLARPSGLARPALARNITAAPSESRSMMAWFVEVIVFSLSASLCAGSIHPYIRSKTQADLHLLAI
jgi:hypothetical protein